MPATRDSHMNIAKSVKHDLDALLGPNGILAQPADKATYEKGYRYGAGRALAVARPATSGQVADVVRYCYRNDIRLIPQGANTGLVGASTPSESGDQLVLSTDRLTGVDAIDVGNRSAVMFSGTRLSEINQMASAHELFFPIDLGADPTIGGMVATNTGGSRLLHYGDVRANVLGLEVVLADSTATVLTDLTGLRKDNSGVDWQQLFIGTAGSFGIVTRVQIELRRLPRQAVCALIVPASHSSIPAILTRLESEAGEFLTAFEGMSRNALRAAFDHNHRLRNPFDAAQGLPEYAVLVEMTSTIRDTYFDLSEVLTELLGQLLSDTDPLIIDAIFGRSEDFWAIRHSISDGVAAAGKVVAFDISVPRSQLPAFRQETVASIEEGYPFLRICDFGHCGDGGDHFNIVWPNSVAQPYDVKTVMNVRTLVYDRVVRKYGGSFSAEHGVGPYNLEYYRRYVSGTERKFAYQLKKLCDPKGLLANVDFG